MTVPFLTDLNLKNLKALFNILALIVLKLCDCNNDIFNKLKYNWSLKSSPNWFWKKSLDIVKITQFVFAIASVSLLCPSKSLIFFLF